MQEDMILIFVLINEEERQRQMFSDGNLGLFIIYGLDFFFNFCSHFAMFANCMVRRLTNTFLCVSTGQSESNYLSSSHITKSKA